MKQPKNSFGDKLRSTGIELRAWQRLRGEVRWEGWGVKDPLPLTSLAVRMRKGVLPEGIDYWEDFFYIYFYFYSDFYTFSSDPTSVGFLSYTKRTSGV